MFKFFKRLIVGGVVGATLLTGSAIAAYAVFGEARTHAVVHEVHQAVLEEVDRAVQDPAILRAQLREMEEEYPKRISQVRTELAEVRHDIQELEREQLISERVVALVDEDLVAFEDTLANLARPASAGMTQVSYVKVDGRPMTESRAYSRLSQLRQQKAMHQDRAADSAHDLTFLRKQAEQLEELQLRLETERTEFKTQISGLSRQIDAIARNDRLIGLLEKRNRTIEEFSRYEACSLDQISSRLEQIRSRQEAELDILSNEPQPSDYEDLARMQLATENLQRQMTAEEGVLIETTELIPNEL